MSRESVEAGIRRVAREESEAILRDAAHQFGFDNVADFRTWHRLNGLREANLTLRASQGSGEFRDREGQLLERGGYVVGRLVFGHVARLKRFCARCVGVLYNVSVSHDVSVSERVS